MGKGERMIICVRARIEAIGKKSNPPRALRRETRRSCSPSRTKPLGRTIRTVPHALWLQRKCPPTNNTKITIVQVRVDPAQ